MSANETCHQRVGRLKFPPHMTKLSPTVEFNTFRARDGERENVCAPSAGYMLKMHPAAIATPNTTHAHLCQYQVNLQVLPAHRILLILLNNLLVFFFLFANAVHFEIHDDLITQTSK